MVRGQRSEVRGRKSEVTGQRSVIRTRRMSKVQTRVGAAAAARLAYFLRRLSLDLVGIARVTKGDVTLAEEKFAKSCGNLPALLRASPVSKVRTDLILFPVRRSVVFPRSSAVSRALQSLERIVSCLRLRFVIVLGISVKAEYI